MWHDCCSHVVDLCHAAVVLINTKHAVTCTFCKDGQLPLMALLYFKLRLQMAYDTCTIQAGTDVLNLLNLSCNISVCASNDTRHNTVLQMLGDSDAQKMASSAASTHTYC
jgi:hypothetical protein